ncbi:MAG: hypothetical protein NC548_33270 [Lachnospiraceae bacterium]|nr:hypothetical protein [Lachnospiraceae bacterium]
MDESHITVAANNNNVVYRYFDPIPVIYRVAHYVEEYDSNYPNATDNYVRLGDVQEYKALYGTVLTNSSEGIGQLTDLGGGYTFDRLEITGTSSGTLTSMPSTGVVLDTDTMTFKYYYRLNGTTVTVKDIDITNSGDYLTADGSNFDEKKSPILGTAGTINAKPGQYVHGWMITDPLNPYKGDGYSMGGETGFRVSGDSMTNLVVYRMFLKNGGPYKVYHRLQINGSSGEVINGKTYQTRENAYKVFEGNGKMDTILSPSVEEITGYTSPEPTSIRISSNVLTNEQTVDYFYDFDNNCIVTCIDLDRDTNIELGQKQKKATYKSTVRGSDVSNNKYPGYKYISDTSVEVDTNSSKNIVYRYFEASDSEWKAYHYYETQSGGWELKYTDGGVGEIGDPVTPETKPTPGYKTPETQTATLEKGKIVEISYYYPLETYKVKVVDMVKDTDIKLGETMVEGQKYGSLVSGSVIGSNTALDYYYKGYSYHSCTSKNVSATGTTVVYRYFSADNINYTVHHELQSLDNPSRYERVKTETFTGSAGEEVYPQPLTEYQTLGFILPSPKSGIVKEDGSLEIIYQYDRNSFDVTYIDRVKGTDIILNQKKESKKVGTTVSGADLGTSETIGAYYSNYKYVGCTSDVVKPGGTVVYRDFESTVAKYTAHHQYETLDGSFEERETVEETGPINTQVTPPLIPVTGYVSPSTQTITITADNSASVTYKYTLKRCEVTYIDIDRESGSELGRQTQEKPYGSEVAGSDLGSDTTVGKFYPEFTYSNCTKATVGLSGTTVYRYFIKGGTKYKVVHKLQVPDTTTYITKETEEFSEKSGTEVTPEVHNYVGYTSPSPQTIVVKPDGTSEVVYLYTVNNYSVTYIDKVKDSSKILGQSMEKKPFGTKVAGSDKGYSTVADTYYRGYMYDSCTEDTVKTTGTTVYRYFVSALAEYTVEHQQEQLDGSFLTVETETNEAVINSKVTPPVREYDGFTSPNTKTVTVKADGPTVITYQYRRNKYEVTYIDRVKGSAIELGRSTETKPYNTPIAGSDKGSSRNVGAYYEGYAYDSCTSGYVRETNNIVYRYFVSKISGCRVYHQQEQFDGSFITVDIDTITANAGDVTTPPTKEYEGFTSPDTQTITVKDDGTSSVTYKYTRTRYDVTFIDRDKITKTELGRSTEPRMFGDTVYGSEKGDLKVVGAYYKDYVYVSCTSVVVSDAENIVYRDFASNVATYTVEHQQEQFDGTYTTVETEVLGGEINSKVTPPTKDYEGFISPDTQTITVKADGSAKVIYKYNRREYIVTYIDKEKDSSKELGRTTEKKPYGMIIAGSDLGSSTKTDEYYDGYSYHSCTSDTVKTSGTVVYRYFVLKETKYKVYHYQEQLSGEYTLVEENTLRGETGTQVTPPVNNYVGFTSPKPQTITVKADGSSSVSYYYDRNDYEVTYIDMVRNTKEELGRSVEEKPYGAVVSGSDKGSSVAPNAYYDGYAYTSCTTAIVDVSGTTVYRYFIAKKVNEPNEKTVEYNVYHKQEQFDGTYITVENEILVGAAGEKVTPPVRTYEGFTSPSPQTVVIAEDGSTVVIYKYNIASKNADYKVLHQQQQLDGSYVTVESETLRGVIGKTVTPPVKKYTGFTSPQPQTVSVKADGSTVVIYKYNRNIYSVIYIDAVKDSGEELGRVTEKKPYGTFISGSDKGSDVTVNAYYNGYAYNSCTSATVESDNTIVYRYFIVDKVPSEEPANANYKVLHQQEQPDGSFLTVDMETLNAEIGTEVTPPTKTYPEFTSPETQTVIVEADGSTTVIYQYTRNSYTVTYIDADKDTGKELGKTTEDKKYGSVVSGADKGEDKTVSAYYKDYIYESCTTATVGTNGATVYRYFVLDKDNEPEKKTEYKVIHMEEQPDGTYESVETEIFEGKPGEEVTPEPKPRDGFETPVKQTITIEDDGSSEVIYKYERKKYDVTYIDMVKDSETELGRSVEKVKLGYTVAGSDKGEDKTVSAYYENYVYDSCTSAVVKTSGTTVYRYFVLDKKDDTKPDDEKPKESTYKIIYEEEQPDGTYKVVEEEIHKGPVGEEVTPTPPEKEGFETPKPETIVINEDGTASITYRYERKSYDVTYIDKVKGSKTELGRTVGKKKFESTVSGAEKGTDKAVGAYYKDYSYDSCTTATVTTSGATVYRYFVLNEKKDDDNKPKEADYTIIYQEEQPDGTYVTVEKKVSKGTVGDKITVDAPDKEGFETPKSQTIVIKEDGSAEIVFKYARKSYKVTYIDVVSGTNRELGKTTDNKKFGTVIYGSDLGSSKTVGAYYNNYIYDSCTSATVTTSGATVYRYFNENQTTVVNKTQSTTVKDTANKNVVKTGETSIAWVFIVSAILAVIGCTILVIRRKKK